MSQKRHNIVHVIFISTVALLFVGIPLFVGCLTDPNNSAVEEQTFVPKVVGEGDFIRVQSLPKTYHYARKWSVEYWDDDNQFNAFYTRADENTLTYSGKRPQVDDPIQIIQVSEFTFEIRNLIESETEDETETSDSRKGPPPERSEQ